MKEVTIMPMDRLTKKIPGTDVVVFTAGERYEETTAAEMTTTEVRMALRALNQYEEKAQVIDKLYLEKCEEVNALRAQLAAAKGEAQ